MAVEVAVLGGGCFWCLDAVYLDVEGVQAVESGYAGGSVVNPSYEQVCQGTTGHAEVVRVSFDPAKISYREILGIFFGIHDPTTLNRQGADVGTQYRSVVFYLDETQQAQAQALIDELARGDIFDRLIVTQVAPMPDYYRAEAYHQRYFEQHPYQGYCMAVVAPKMTKFRKQFASKLRRA